MYNPHPLLTGFPFVLLAILFATDLFALLRGQNYPDFTKVLWIALLVFAVLTYLSGHVAAYQVRAAHPCSELTVIDQHQGFAKLTLLLITPAFLLRLIASRAKGLALSYIGLAAISFGMVTWTSHLGGRLVFKHGLGVDKSALAAAEACR